MDQGWIVLALPLSYNGAIVYARPNFIGAGLGVIVANTKTNKQIQRPKNVATKVRSKTVNDVAEKGAEIADNDSLYTFYTGRDLLSLVRAGKPAEAVRRMVRTSDGIVSSDITTKATIANSGYTVTAYDAATGEFSIESTIAASNVLKSLGRVYDYTKGFVSKPSIAEVVYRMLVDTQITGAPMCELVMNKERLPDWISTIPYDQIVKVANSDGTWYPRQKLTGTDEVDLNYPNVFVSEMLRDSGSRYAISPAIPALRAIFDLRVFEDDAQRALNRNGHGRTVVVMNWENTLAAAPDSVKNDEKALYNWAENEKTKVQTSLASLNPEDALVVWDTADVSTQDGNGSRSEYSTLLNSKQGAAATSMKSTPSALGMRMEGSQSLSNTESLIYLRHCEALQKPVVDVMSRMMTFACRMLGMDVTVDFKFLPINLRPETELEAFESSKQNRLMDQLSVGLISDQHFYHIIGLPPRNTNLSGTGFRSGSTAGVPETTSGPQEDTLQPDNDLPRRGGGRDQ